MRRWLAFANEHFKAVALISAQPHNVLLDADILSRHESSPPLPNDRANSENSINNKDADHWTDVRTTIDTARLRAANAFEVILANLA